MKNKPGVLRKVEKVSNMILSIKYLVNTRNYDQLESSLEALKDLVKDLEQTIDLEDDYYLNRY